MSTPAPEYSDDFVETARAEAERLRVHAERLRQESARYSELAERAAEEAFVVECRARELDELLGRAPQMRLDLQSEALRGKQLRETAIEILARRRKLGEPLHYRDWFRLVLDEGHRIDGKDPLATFLTQVTRSPVVRRDPERPGVYRVDPDQGSAEALRELDQARAALAAAREELERARRDRDPAVESLAQRAGVLGRRVAAAERALAEAARVNAAVGAGND